MTDEKIRLLFEKCSRDKANDKKLPSDSFVVSYNDKEELKYDIVRASAQVDVFDAYYDKYKMLRELNGQKVSFIQKLMMDRQKQVHLKRRLKENEY